MFLEDLVEDFQVRECAVRAGGLEFGLEVRLADRGLARPETFLDRGPEPLGEFKLEFLAVFESENELRRLRVLEAQRGDVHGLRIDVEFAAYGAEVRDLRGVVEMHEVDSLKLALQKLAGQKEPAVLAEQAEEHGLCLALVEDLLKLF